MSNEEDYGLGFFLTLHSGIVCMDWSEFKEKAEELMGHQIWTHEFADEDFILEMKIRWLTRVQMSREESNIETSPIKSLEKKVDRDKVITVMTDEEELVFEDGSSMEIIGFEENKEGDD